MLKHSIRLRTVLIWLALTVSLAGCSTEIPRAKTGEPAPAFILQQLNGELLQFPADLKGKVVAIQFWADWCPPCIREMRLLAPAYASYQARGVVILAINLRQDKATVMKLVEKLNAPYEFLLDIEGDVAQTYGVETLPTSFIVDREGRIKTRLLGETTPETFEQLIRSVL